MILVLQTEHLRSQIVQLLSLIINHHLELVEFVFEECHSLVKLN